MAETVKGLKIEFSADTSKFNKEMRNFNKGLSSTKKEAKSLNDSLKLEWNADKFKKAQKLAQKAITDTSYKAEVLRKRLKMMEEAGITDKNREEHRKWQVELTKTDTKVLKLEKSLEKLNNIKLDNLKKKVENIGQSFTKAGQAMVPVSAAAATLTAAIGGATLKTIGYADEIATTANQLNISAEQLQKFQYIAMQTDVSNAQLTKGFTKLRTAVGQSLMGTSNMATKSLEELGFTIDELQGKSDEQIFNQVIAELGQVENTSKQAALASQIFGEKVSTDLIPLLKVGADGLNQLSQEFEAVGYMSEESINKLAEFDNVMNRIKASFANIVHTVGVAFLPLFESISNTLISIIPHVQKLADWFTTLSVSQQGLIVGIGSLLSALAPALLIIGKLTSSVGGLIKFLPILKTAFSSLLGPIGIILGIFTLLYAKNEQFRESINGLFSTLMDTLMPVFNLLGDTLNQLLEALNPLIDELLNALAPLLLMMVPVFDAILKALQPIINILVKVLGWYIQKVMIPYFSVMIKGLTLLAQGITKLIPWIGNLTKTFTSLVVKALEPTLSKFKTIWSLIKKIMNIKDKKVKIDVDYDEPGTTSGVSSSTQSAMQNQSAMQDVITNNSRVLSNSNISNTDNRAFNFNITVNNNGNEIREDELSDKLFDKINRKLVEQY